MATEEPSNPPDAAPVSVLPQYSELILAAIEALDSKKGANKSRISRHIEASYGSLPAAHKTLLSHHLNKMKASGELVVIQNNYVVPEPNSPPTRGRGRPSKPKEPVPEGTVPSSPKSRGRPPKPKEPLPEGTVATPPRPRGRPPKSDTALVPFPSSPSLSGRKRGRPPKTPGGTPAKKSGGSGRGRGRPRKDGAVSGMTSSPAPSTSGKRGRGRPPKMKTAVGTTLSPSSGEKRGRGRPPKLPKIASTPFSTPLSGEKKARGRPPKVVVQEAPVEAESPVVAEPLVADD